MTSLEYQCLCKEILTRPNPLQASPAIAQKVLVSIKISPDAKPGKYELRLLCGNGISNPLSFEVSNCREYTEDYFVSPRKEKKILKIDEFPAVINGEIMPGERDSVFFQARKGEKICFSLKGRALIPFLGDAVPGWFQPFISIYDSKKYLISYADDHYHAPDPILNFCPHRDGEYEIEIRDSIYRGREDFVYRLYAEKISADNQLETELRPPSSFSHLTLLNLGDERTNPNRQIQFPCLISNTFLDGQTTHLYSANFAEGEKIIFESYARRGGSPTDTIIQIFDSDNKIIAANDDYKNINFSFLAQHADSYCAVNIKSSGKYQIRISETQRKSGKDYKYLLRIDHPRQDFAAFLYPSAINCPPGAFAPVNVKIERFDEFNADIKIKIKDAPNGTFLAGETIPQNSSQNTFTIFVPPTLKNGVYQIKLSATAEINGTSIERELIPCDELMQAFIYTHLFPSKESLLCVGGRKISLPNLEMPEKLIFSPGETKEVSIKSKDFHKVDRQLEFEFHSAPDGLKIIESKLYPDSCSIKIQCAENAKAAHQNIIFQVRNNDKKNNRKSPPVILPPILTQIQPNLPVPLNPQLK